MKLRKLVSYAVSGCLVLIAAGVAAPFISARRFGNGVKAALERALGREVEIGAVHYNLFTGPGFWLEKVVIHEHPSMGPEPFAYVGSLQAALRVWSLAMGRLEFASITLEDASINLAKTGGPSEPGRWNFEPLLQPSLMRTFPEIHVRNGRINFKFANAKSVFYLSGTDLDISPPSPGGTDWSVRFSGEPSRTDRPARGFGSLAARGRWIVRDGGRLDLDVQVDKNAIGEIIALLKGQPAGVHGSLSCRMHLAGPLDDIRIAGRMYLEDIHRWDLLPPKGSGWPLWLRGRWNLVGQTLELESSSSEKEGLPLWVRLRTANYLVQPHWGVALNWNRFPVAHLLELARHMGASLPPRLKMTGTVDGAIGYDDESGLQGELAFHDTAVVIPESPPVRFEHARMLFAQGHAHLAPALVRTAEDEQAQLEADYRWDDQMLNLTISTGSMQVATLRSQASLAAVPWLEQARAGQWKGQLRYQHCAPESAGCDARGWSGRIELQDARFPVPGLEGPLEIRSARAEIDGPRVVLDHMRAQAGGIALEGEYRYEPALARPHRVRVVIPEADAAELERLLRPTLRRERGLIARLGLARTRVPEWLGTRRLEGAVQIGSLLLGGSRVEKLRGRLIWDGARLTLDRLQAGLDGGSVEGALTVNLRGARPAYRLTARSRNLSWKSGKLDGEGVLETSGTGAELLANLRAEGTFTGRLLEMASLPVLKTVTGSYVLAWPRVRFPELQLSTGLEVYTGRGATQEDGKLLIQLSSGQKEMRVSGTLAQMHLEETGGQ